MFNMFFGNIFALLTTVLVLILLAFISLTFIRRSEIKKWGMLILIIILAGAAVSGLCATRDAFMTESALFSINSLQSVVCSIAGGLIFITGIVAIFIRNQKFRKLGFGLVSILFIIQVITIEASRIILNMGGAM